MNRYPDIQTALRSVLGAERTSRSFAEIRGQFSNSEIARAIVGARSGPLPKKGTAKRREYESTMRRLQRAQAEPGRQLRRLTDAFLSIIRRSAPKAVSSVRMRSVRSTGLHMRLRASIRVSKVVRVHTMPANGREHLPGASLEPTLEAWAARDTQRAEDELLSAFFIKYWGVPNPAEVVEVFWVELSQR